MITRRHGLTRTPFSPALNVRTWSAAVSRGYSVARYSNNDIYTNLSGVAEDIMIKIGMEV